MKVSSTSSILFLFTVFNTIDYSQPVLNDLFCVCGKGGACIDRSHVDMDHLISVGLPRTHKDCFCDLVSKGLYTNCTQLIDYCDDYDILEQCPGTCQPAFGSYYCECDSSSMGINCLEFRPIGVSPVESPMTFQFIHTPENEAKKFYLVVKDFGTQFKAVVSFNDGRKNLNLNQSHFDEMNMRKFCLEQYYEHPLIHDKQTCLFFTYPNYFVATLTPNYRTGNYYYWKPGSSHTISVQYFNGNFITFKGEFTFFTPFYGTSNRTLKRNPCEYEIIFKGCGGYYNTRRHYYTTDAIIVSAIKIPVTPCQPIWKRYSYWRYYPNDTDIYVEVAGDEENLERKIFDPMTFKRGTRWIEFYYVEIGDESLYGVSNKHVSKGRCSITVQKGYGQLYFVGGTTRRYPCYEPVRLEVASSNPGVPINAFHLEWSCDEQIDGEVSGTRRSFCQPILSRGNTYTYEEVPCESFYSFNVRLISDDITNAETSQEIYFVPGVPEFYITCLYNCFVAFQNSDSLRVSYYISVFSDSYPTWQIIVGNDERTHNYNRTDKNVLFIPEVEGVLEPEMLGHNITVICTLGENKAWLKIPIVGAPIRSRCRTEPKVISVFESFNVHCNITTRLDSPDAFYWRDYVDRILDMVLVEEPVDWKPGFLLEPVEQTSSFDMFGLVVKTERVSLLFLDTLWGKPMMYGVNSEQDIIKNEVNKYEMNLAMNHAYEEFEEALIIKDYDTVVTKLSTAGFLWNQLSNIEDSDERVYEDDTRFELFLVLAKVPPPKSTVDVIRLLGVFHRMSIIHSTAAMTDRSNRHKTMFVGSKIIWNTVVSFEKVLADSEPFHWVKSVLQDIMWAFVEICTNLLVMAKSDFEVRRLRKTEHYPYFVYYTSEAGANVLNLLELLRTSIFPLSVYELPVPLGDNRCRMWFKSDTLSVINEELVAHAPYNEENYIVSWGGANTTFFHFNLISLFSDAFWWTGDKVIVSKVVSTTLTDVTTQKRVQLSNNFAQFLIAEMDQPEFWLGGPVLMGRAINSPVDAPEEIKDRSLRVWQIDAPRPSAGKLFLLQNNEKMKIYSKLGVFPSYSDVFNSPSFEPHTIHEMDFRVPVETGSSKIYVAVLPGSDESSPSFNREAEDETEVSYVLHPTGLICLTYIKGDWKRGECKISKSMSKAGMEIVKCSCPRVSWHAVEKAVFKARQVLSDYGYTVPHVPGNYIVIANLFAIIVFFTCLLVWAYRRDKTKVHLNVLHLLEAPQVGYTFPYLVVVHTGSQVGSGSNSSIGFRLIGTSGHCGPHLFRYRMTSERLSTGNEDWFLIEAQKNLGELTRIDIWNDFAGSRIDWYCEKILVYDIMASVAYDFSIQKWLAQSDYVSWVSYQSDAPLPSVLEAGSDEKKYHFVPELRRYLADQLLESHRWFSFFTKTKRNINLHVEQALLLMNFVFVVMSATLLFRATFTGGALDATDIVFKTKEANTAALVLIVAYVVYAIEIFLFEKSHETTKKLKPSNAESFQRVVVSGTGRRALTRFKRQRPVKSMTRVGRFRRILMVMNKNFQAHLFTPPNYFLWFDPTDVRKAARPEVLEWALLRRVVYLAIFCLSVSYIIIRGLKIGRVASLQWMLIYWVAIIGDVIFIEPIRVIIKSTLLFYFYRRRSWDNFYVHGITNVEWKEHDRLNYYQEMVGRISRKKMKYERIAKAKMMFRTFISSQWFALSVALTLLISFSFILSSREIKMKWVKIRGVRAMALEPTATGIGLSDAKNQLQFFQYITQTFLPSFHKVFWYNGKPLPRSEEAVEVNVSDPWAAADHRNGWTADYYSQVFGAPVVVQNRVRPSHSLAPIMSSYYNGSGGLLDFHTKETKNFSRQWTDYEEIGQKRGTWTYDDDFGGPSFLWGSIRIPVMGYVHVLPTELGPSKRNITTLYLNNWFDNRTRELLFQVTTFSPFLKIYDYVELKVTVTPNNLYSGRLWVYSSRVSVRSEHADYYRSWIYFMTILTILSVLRIWSITRVRGATHYAYESDFSVDVLTVLCCVVIILYCSVLALKDHLSSVYIAMSYKYEYVRLFEMYSLELVACSLTGLVTILTQFTSMPTLRRYYKVGVEQGTPYLSIIRVMLASYLVLFYYAEITRGIVFLIDRPVHLNLIARTITRDMYVFYRPTTDTDSVLHSCFLILGFILIKMITIASIHYAYDCLPFKVKPVKRGTLAYVASLPDETFGRPSTAAMRRSQVTSINVRPSSSPENESPKITKASALWDYFVRK